MNALISLVPLFTVWADEVPDPHDVKAGWVAFGVFIALGLAVAFLGYSLTKHLRKARDNADRGVFDPSERSSDTGNGKPTPSAH
jgi:hypothetical protein